MHCSCLSFSSVMYKNHTKLSSARSTAPTAGYRTNGWPMSSYVLEGQMASLVARLRIVTAQGRKHQVRLHCSKGLKAPILLDPLYGGEAVLFQIKSPILHRLRVERKFCSHAESLVIPEFGVNAQAPIPDWWQEIVTEAQMQQNSHGVKRLRQ